MATKYPEITRRHFAARGVQAECIKLNGAIELAPRLGLCRHIVDLVQTGATLKANGLIEIEPIAKVSSRLIVNRPALKTRPEKLAAGSSAFATAIGNRPSAPASRRAGKGGVGRADADHALDARSQVRSGLPPTTRRKPGECGGCRHRRRRSSMMSRGAAMPR